MGKINCLGDFVMVYMADFPKELQEKEPLSFFARHSDDDSAASPES